MIQYVCVVAVIVFAVCGLLVYASVVLGSRCDRAAERYREEKRRGEK